MIISYHIEWFNVNRKIAISAIMVAFVAGMFFAGTPVEAAQGGVGALIDELWLAIDSLDGRVVTLENTPHFDPSGLQTQIDSNDSDILQLQTDVFSSDGRLNGIYEKTFTNLLFGFPTPESDPILERVFKCNGNDTVISGGFEGNLNPSAAWIQKSWIDSADNEYELEIHVSSTTVKKMINVKIQCLPE